MSARKKKFGLLVGMIWYWISWLFFAPQLIFYLFDAPNLLSELVAEFLTVGIPALLLASIHFRVDDTKVALYKIDDNPIKNIPLGTFLGGMASCVGLFFFVTYAVNTVQLVYGLRTGEFVVTSLPEEFGFGTLITIIVVNALLPAVFEEIIYRGLYVDAFRQNKKRIIYLVPTFVFASLHSGVISFISAFLLGLMLIVFYEKFRSLKLVIIMHFLYNILGVIFGNCIIPPFSVLSVWLSHPNDTQLLISIIVSACITLLSLLLAIFLFVLCIHKSKQSTKNTQCDTRAKENGEGALTICLFVLAILTLALNVLMNSYF